MAIERSVSGRIAAALVGEVYSKIMRKNTSKRVFQVFSGIQGRIRTKK